MQSLRYRQEFKDLGFTVLRKFFSNEEIMEVFEEIQRAEPRKAGSSALDKGGLIFKHNLFYRSPYLQGFISQKKVIDFLREIIGEDIWVRWDQAVAKIPGAPEFPWHQDNGYNSLKQEHFQLWVALTEMTRGNGTLWLQPGSHKRGVLPHTREGSYAVCPGNPDQALCIEADKGDVILFSSLMLHRTSANYSHDIRWAYVIEYMSLDQFDPHIRPPYFIVARDGKPSPQFVHLYRGRFDPRNHMMYLIPRLGRFFPWARAPVKKALSKIRELAGRS